MDAILLPLVADSISLTDAFGRMKSAGRSGIVAQRNQEYVLYTAADVLRAIKKKGAGADSLDSLRHEPVQTIDVGSVAARAVTGHLAMGDLLGELKDVSNYGLLAAGPSQGRTEALLFTRFETLRDLLEPWPSDCCCPKDECQRQLGRDDTCPDHGVKSICS